MCEMSTSLTLPVSDGSLSLVVAISVSSERSLRLPVCLLRVDPPVAASQCKATRTSYHTGAPPAANFQTAVWHWAVTCGCSLELNHGA